MKQTESLYNQNLHVDNVVLKATLQITETLM